jgi:hypothetical protein
MCPNAGVGQNEADCVIDAARCDFIGVEQERGDGQATGIRAGTLLSASRRGIYTVQIPNGEQSGMKNSIIVGCGVCLIQLAMGTINHDVMAILF